MRSSAAESTHGGLAGAQRGGGSDGKAGLCAALLPKCPDAGPCQRAALTRLLGLHLERWIEQAEPVGRLSHNGGVTARQDLPGYSGNQETEALGLLEVQRYLVTQGFKVTQVAGRFDDGLDLLLSPHDEKNVLPAIAGIQVRSGPSHRGLAVGRHERYWRELNLPVFGIVLTDPRSNPPSGYWCDAQGYLRDHIDVPAIPTPNRFPDGLVDAIDLANEVHRALASALDVFSLDWRQQAGSIAALVPLATDPRVTEMLRLRLGGLGPRATQYALELLVEAEERGEDSRVTVERIARSIEVLYEADESGYLDLDAFHYGTSAAYRLLELRGSDPSEVLNAAFKLHGEGTIMVIAMAVSLAAEDGDAILREAVSRRPNLVESPDIDSLASALEDGGYHFSW